MRAVTFWKLVVVGVALSLCGCAAVEAERQAQEQKQQQFVQRLDTAHVFVTTGPAPTDKKYSTLGDLKYTEPFTPDAIDSAKMESRLKKMALDKYPDAVDEIVNEKSDVSPDGSTVTVSAEAIQFESSADRAAMHKMNEGMVVSPNNQ